MAVADWHVILVEGVHTIHVSSVGALFLQQTVGERAVAVMWRTLLVFFSTYRTCRGKSHDHETQHPCGGHYAIYDVLWLMIII